MLVAITIIVVALLFFWMVDQGGKRDTALKERQAVRQYELDYQQGQLKQLELQLKLAQAEERKLLATKLPTRPLLEAAENIHLYDEGRR